MLFPVSHQQEGGLQRVVLMIVMEYTPCGDLLSFLRKSRGMEDRHRIGPKIDVRELTKSDLVNFACQIASGMEFLHARGVRIL